MTKNFILTTISVVAAVLLFAFAGTIGKMVGKAGIENFNDGRRQGILDEVQLLAAQAAQKQLPIKVDEYTTWNTAIAAGAKLIYGYTVNIDMSEISPEEFTASMTEVLKQSVCNQKEMKSTMDMGGSYRYTYKSADGILFSEIDISSDQCR